MYVVATAGHVDHGKSTLVRQLTGMEPDRWAEERRRGLTIDLGFAWTTLPGGAVLAFVDVPGHERFVPNMLAGVGPVPACMFVVAADEGWRPQSTEHLAALDGLGVRHGLLVVTRSDLADPEPARAEALERLASTTLGTVPSVAVSGRTGAGLDDLRAALVALTARLPAPDVDADVRLWVDRSFSVRGAGTVVTGTLAAGMVRTGDDLVLSTDGRRVRVRGVQTLGQDVTEVRAVARVAVNLRGVERSEVGRGDALLTPDAWLSTEVVDVAVRDAAAEPPTGQLVLHVGSAAVPVRARALGAGAVRLTLADPLPLRTGDRGLLRDPSRQPDHQLDGQPDRPPDRQRIAAGVVVLDVRPPELVRRGAARARAAELTAAGLTAAPGAPSAPAAERIAALSLRHSGFLLRADLLARGLPVPADSVRLTDEWYADELHWARLLRQATDELALWTRANPVAAGMPSEVLRQRLGIPDTTSAGLVEAVAAGAGLSLRDGLVSQSGGGPALPSEVEKAVRAVEEDLAAAPFAAPDAHRLAALGLGTRELAAAVRAERLCRIADGVVLLPDAVERALATLAGLAQPFTLSTARKALGTTRRVAVPLLELLDRRGLTERLSDGTHRLRA